MSLTLESVASLYVHAGGVTAFTVVSTKAVSRTLLRSLWGVAVTGGADGAIRLLRIPLASSGGMEENPSNWSPVGTFACRGPVASLQVQVSGEDLMVAVGDVHGFVYWLKLHV